MNKRRRTTRGATLRRGPRFKSPRKISVNQAYENKTFDLISNFSLVGGTNILGLLSQISQGSNVGQRIGQYITYTSIYINWKVELPWSQAVPILQDSQIYNKIYLIYDNAPNQVAPSLATIFTEPTETITMITREYSSRFFVLAKSATFQLQDYDTVGGNIYTPGVVSVLKTGTIYAKCQLPAQFQGTAGGIANTTKGAIWLAIISSKATADVLTFRFKVRINFTDQHTSAVIAHKGRNTNLIDI